MQKNINKQTENLHPKRIITIFDRVKEKYALKSDPEKHPQRKVGQAKVRI